MSQAPLQEYIIYLNNEMIAALPQNNDHVQKAAATFFGIISLIEMRKAKGQ